MTVTWYSCHLALAQVWRGLLAVVHKLHASLSELQRFGLKAEILCDDTLDLRQRLGGDRPDWACLQQLARLYEAKLLAAPQCADEARVAGALHRFAAKMDAAGTLSPATSEPAARLLEETDGRARRAGSSLAFAVATALLCDVPLFELDFDGIGQLSFCAATGVLAIPLMEVKTAPAKGEATRLLSELRISRARPRHHSIRCGVAAASSRRRCVRSLPGGCTLRGKPMGIPAACRGGRQRASAAAAAAAANGSAARRARARIVAGAVGGAGEVQCARLFLGHRQPA